MIVPASLRFSCTFPAYVPSPSTFTHPCNALDHGRPMLQATCTPFVEQLFQLSITPCCMHSSFAHSSSQWPLLLPLVPPRRCPSKQRRSSKGSECGRNSAASSTGLAATGRRKAPVRSVNKTPKQRGRAFWVGGCHGRSYLDCLVQARFGGKTRSDENG